MNKVSHSGQWLMSECGDKPVGFSLMLLAEIGDVMEGVWCHSSWHWPAAATTQPVDTARLVSQDSSAGWPVVIDKLWRQSGPSFNATSTAPRSSGSSILCRYLHHLKACSQGTGRPRLQMTSGLAGGTHPSPERISFYLHLDTMCQHCILFPGKGAVYDAAAALEDI